MWSPAPGYNARPWLRKWAAFRGRIMSFPHCVVLEAYKGRNLLPETWKGIVTTS